MRRAINVPVADTPAGHQGARTVESLPARTM